MRRLTAGLEADFYRLHGVENGAEWCRCVAWWTPTWTEFAARTADENLVHRRALFAAGRHDGYLLYVDGEPAAWCQVGPRDRLPKLGTDFDLPPDPEVWAITCFLVAPARRGRGLARRLLQGVLTDLPARGVSRVQAFPSRGPEQEDGEAWTGPERLFDAAGFRQIKPGSRRSVWEIGLQA